MRSRRDGFTLIELLIVVVIIGILAAIAIPKFASSKEQAYLSTMKSDLRNLATAQESYQYENQAYYGGAIPSASLFYVASTGVTVALLRSNSERMAGHSLAHADPQAMRHLRRECGPATPRDQGRRAQVRVRTTRKAA